MCSCRHVCGCDVGSRNAARYVGCAHAGHVSLSCRCRLRLRLLYYHYRYHFHSVDDYDANDDVDDYADDDVDDAWMRFAHCLRDVVDA